MKKNKLIINKQNSHNVRKHWQLTIGSQYFKLSYCRKNDALITLRNICHDDTSTPNLTNNWLMCRRAWSWKTLHKLFSDVQKRSRKWTVRISIRLLTGKKPKYFWHSSTVCLEHVTIVGCEICRLREILEAVTTHAQLVLLQLMHSHCCARHFN